MAHQRDNPGSIRSAQPHNRLQQTGILWYLSGIINVIPQGREHALSFRSRFPVTPASLPVDPFDLVIFGGTGDLAMRKLLPALFHRYLAGQIRVGSRIIGAAREPLNDEGYRSAVSVALGNASTHTPEQRDAFLGLIGYYALDARKDDGWDGLAGMLGERPDNIRVFYLSTSPELFVDIC